MDQPTNIFDLGVSVIRTFVPYLAALVVAKLTAWGIAIDDDIITGQFVAVGGTVWYIIVRLLERKFPKAGWLLGAPRAPIYEHGTQPAPDVPGDDN